MVDHVVELLTGHVFGAGGPRHAAPASCDIANRQILARTAAEEEAGDDGNESGAGDNIALRQRNASAVPTGLRGIVGFHNPHAEARG